MTHDEFEASAKKFCDEFNAVAAMQQALEALEGCTTWHLTREQYDRNVTTIVALRAALAETAMQQLTDVQQEIKSPRVNQCAEVCERAKLCAICARGLENVQQDMDCYGDGNVYRGQRSSDSQYQTIHVQEPVAWMLICASGEEDDITYEEPSDRLLPGWSYRALYTHPPRRKWVDLTEEEIEWFMKWPEKGTDLLAFARAIEAKLKEKNT
jgi:hypothetical protein